MSCLCGDQPGSVGNCPEHGIFAPKVAPGAMTKAELDAEIAAITQRLAVLSVAGASALSKLIDARSKEGGVHNEWSGWNIADIQTWYVQRIISTLHELARPR